jgi:hypothetical protein
MGMASSGPGLLMMQDRPFLSRISFGLYLMAFPPERERESGDHAAFSSFIPIQSV